MTELKTVCEHGKWDRHYLGGRLKEGEISWCDGGRSPTDEELIGELVERQVLVERREGWSAEEIRAMLIDDEDLPPGRFRYYETRMVEIDPR